MQNFSLKNLYYISLSIICAIIAHIIIILYLAFFSSNDTSAVLSKKYELYKFSELQNNEKNLKQRNSFFKYYICPFNIRHKALIVNIKNTGANFWALALYNHKANLIYSLNSELINHKDLNLIVGSQMEMSLLKKYYNNHDLELSTIVPRPIEKGIAILKIYTSNNNELKQAQTLIQHASCKALM